MIDPNDARFSSEVLSVSTANPGWQVHVKHLLSYPQVRGQETDHETRYPIAAWAVVRRSWGNTEDANAVEPVFVQNGSLINATEYRRRYSDLEPEAGEPEVAIHIEVESPEV